MAKRHFRTFEPMVLPYIGAVLQAFISAFVLVLETVFCLCGIHIGSVLMGNIATQLFSTYHPYPQSCALSTELLGKHNTFKQNVLKFNLTKSQFHNIHLRCQTLWQFALLCFAHNIRMIGQHRKRLWKILARVEVKMSFKEMPYFAA